MVERVQEVLDKHVTEWQNHTFIADRKSRLDALITLIHDQEKLRKSHRPMNIKAKDQLRAELVNQARILQNSLVVYASVTGDTGLTELIGRENAVLLSLSDVDLISSVRVQVEQADALKEELADFGISEAQIVATREKVHVFKNDYKKAMDGYQEVNRIISTIDELVKEAVFIAHKQIKPLMNQFEYTSRNFFKDFQYAQRIHNRRAGKITGQPDDESPATDDNSLLDE